MGTTTSGAFQNSTFNGNSRAGTSINNYTPTTTYYNNTVNDPTTTGYYGTDLTGAINAMNASNGKYQLGSYNTDIYGQTSANAGTKLGTNTNYYLYDNPNYQATDTAGTGTNTTGTDTTGTGTSTTGTNTPTATSNNDSAVNNYYVQSLSTDEQPLYTKQLLARNNLADALIDKSANYSPTDYSNFTAAKNALDKVDLSGDYAAANKALNKAYTTYDSVNQRLGSTYDVSDTVNNQAASNFYDLLTNGSIPTSNEAYRKQVQDALMDYQESRLNPTYQQQADALATKLANQGITQNSDTYGSEWDIYNRAKNDAYQTAYSNAITQGEEAIQGQYNRDLASYQQVGNDYATSYNANNTIAGLYSSGINSAQSGINNATSNLHNVYALDVSQAQGLNNTAMNLSAANSAQQLNELQTLMNLSQEKTGNYQNNSATYNVSDIMNAIMNNWQKNYTELGGQYL